MTDADGNKIPYVNDDMGEGIKDFFEEKYGDMLKTSPKQETNTKLSEDLCERLNRLETDIRSIKHAIGNHVLIDGAWVDITKKTVG